MIRLARPQFDADEIAAVVDVLESGNLVQGAKVAAFEKAVAERVGVAHGVACSSGTAALHLAVMALSLEPGDEVIVPTYTFPATANVVELAGGKAKIVDIDPVTFNIRPEAIEQAIGPRTRAIMPVHLFGLCTEMAPILELAEKHELQIIEDAACALGATWTPPGSTATSAGRFGAMACWSFHPRKVITTAEGGMVTTDDPQLAGRLRALRSHGAIAVEGKLQYPEPGLNYRMTDLQGCLGVSQMARLDTFLSKRRALAAAYDAALGSLSWLKIPAVAPGFEHAYQSYITLLDPAIDRDALILRFRERGVQTSIGTYALHEQPHYSQRYGLDPADFPGGHIASAHSLALPLHPGMSLDDVPRVAEALAKEVEQ